MIKPFNLMRFVVSCVVAGAMLAACGGSQMSASPTSMTPQAMNAPNSLRPAGFGPADCGGGDNAHRVNSPGDDGCGCGGGGGDNAHGVRPGDDGNGCCSRGGGDNGIRVRSNDDEGQSCISVTPRSVSFTSSNPGPFTVTVTVHGHPNGTVSELDDCGGASGIATLSQGSGNQWTVTAGPTAGFCKARFYLMSSHGKVVGHATLHITNFI